MHAVDLIHRPAITIEARASIAEAAEQMEQAGVGCLGVVDAGVLIGIVTDRDLVRRGLARHLPVDARVDAVMSAPVVSVAPDAPVSTVFDRFRTHAIRRVAVVRGGHLEGIIAVDDLLVVLSRQLEDIARPVTGELLFAQRDSAVPVVPS
ncbi:MAG: cyclic nucleotide-binding/CBS domain-containing protein [Ilumatobacteraceae bacterium]|jgi:CBS domain-containing protein